MKVWKRCMAALLAFIMIGTSGSISQAAGKLDVNTYTWSATAADIVAESYGLTDNSRITAVLNNGAVDTGAEYTVAAPYDNGTEGRDDLIAVDYINREFYVKSYEADGFTWIPVEAALMVGEEKAEEFTLTEKVCFYNDVEYYASEAFTYDGNSYTVKVTYELSVEIDLEEQQRLLAIPKHIGQASRNIDKTLAGMWYNLKLFGDTIPTLYKMLDMELAIEKMAGGVTKTEYEPFFNETEHAAEITAIKALYDEYMENPDDPQLDMFEVCDEALSTSDSGLVYAMNNGAKVRDTSAALYDTLVILAESGRLTTLYSKMKTLNPELYAELKTFYNYLNGFVGTAVKTGTLETLKDGDNWTIIDKEVQAEIFRKDYDPADFKKLETAAYQMRNTTYEMPDADSEELTAASVEISCDITFYEVSVTVSAQAVADLVGDDTVEALTAYSDSILLLRGTSAEDVETAVRDLGIENHAVKQWELNTAHYKRTQTVVKSSLVSDLDYRISFEPNYYEVKTDFAGNKKVPYGYQLLLPENTQDDGWYDYHVKHKDGTQTDYNQGVIYTVSENVTITRTTSQAKTEHRVYDFLAADEQYQMNEESQKILLNPAVYSPYVKVRMPDEAVSEIVYNGTDYEITAKSFASGISGMTWEPCRAVLLDGTETIDTLNFQNGKVYWTTPDFTHANVVYSLNITKARYDGNLTNSSLSAEDISYSVNLPHILVDAAVKQNQALCGSGAVTAKSVYQDMKSHEGLMSLLPNLKEEMRTQAAIDALKRLQGNEKDTIKDSSGKVMGCGGWSSTSDEAAFFKYLRLCEDSGWSLATFYKEGYYSKIEEQALLIADCLDVVLDDPGCISLLKEFDRLEQKEKLEAYIPNLRELALKMDGPHEAMNVKHSKFPVLIEELLSAQGQTKYYENADSIIGYTPVRRNGENAGSIKVTVQLGNLERSDTIGYELDTLDGNERYHIFTEENERSLKSMIAELEDACGLENSKKKYYDLSASRLPSAGDKLRGSSHITYVYTPKTYRVMVHDGSVSRELRSFQYGSDYVVYLPAKTNDTSAKTFFCYTLKDNSGNIIVTRAVENGTIGSYRFAEEDLPILFPNDTYTIYLEELPTGTSPEVTLKPTKDKEGILLRGAQVDEKNKYVYLDANPVGITRVQYETMVKYQAANMTSPNVSMTGLDGKELAPTALVGTGTKITYAAEDIYGNPLSFQYTIVMMGDVNGDGINDASDIRLIMNEYFVDEKAGDVPLKGIQYLAANMNNNKKLDTNDAWLVNSKAMYWYGDSKLNQHVYRSVLK